MSRKIGTLKPGPELNEAVALRLGWSSPEPGICAWWRAPGSTLTEWLAGNTELYANAPRFSQDLATAWLAVERLEELGWTWSAENNFGEQKQQRFSCRKWGRGMYPRVGWGEAATLPHAICLAVLRAVRP